MRFLKFLLIVIAVIIFFLSAYFVTDLLFEPRAYNHMVKTFTAHKNGSSDIVLVVIDDKSIGRYRWPWKRNLYCDIYDYFREYTKAKVVLSDSIVTSNDDKLADSQYFNSLSKMDNLVVGITFRGRDYYNQEIGKLYDKKINSKFKSCLIDKREHSNDYPYKSASIFPDEYLKAIKNVGIITSISASDGYIRVSLPALNYKGTLYPSLSLKAYSLLNQNDTLIVTDNYIMGEHSGLKMPLLKEPSGIYSLIKFYKLNKGSGSYSHKTYSAVDIMDSYKDLKTGKKPLINPKEFENKYVLIGANVKAAATGLSDVKETPMSSDHSGLDVQATCLDNILHNDFMYSLPDWLNFAVTILLMLASFLLIRKYSIFPAITSISGLIILYVVMCAIFFRQGYVISILTPITMVIITMIFAYSYKYILEDKNKEKIKSAMGKYISEDIMKNVVKNIDELKLGGKKANVTVLFADIRGFTSMSEKLTADEVSVILNEYFTEIEPIVTQNNGVINKFIGDAVMAIFGEPIQDENHPKNAVRCACQMLEKVKELQTKWLDEGKPKIEIGIGINTGEAFVGNIGSEKRMEYTVIGDMVNLASRIEGNNKIYKTNLLISSSTYAYVKSIVDVVKISNVKIRGKEKELDLYEVIKLVR